MFKPVDLDWSANFGLLEKSLWICTDALCTRYSPPNAVRHIAAAQ
jgi:hypothetical protein